MAKEDYLGRERRKYIRLDTVFPVQFRLISVDGQHFLSDWLQGFTKDVGRGGICLKVNNLDPERVSLLQSGQAGLLLDIEMPIAANPISALSGVAWIKSAFGAPDRYIIGLAYKNISFSDSRRMMRYAWGKKLFVPVLAGVIFLLAIGFGAGSYLNIKLIKGNKALVEQLVKIVQESSIAKQKIKQINRQKEDLQIKIQALEMRIQAAASQAGAFLEKLNQEKDALEKELTVLQYGENSVAEELLRLDRKKSLLEKANFDKIYQWLEVRQNPRTGLITSFEGEGGAPGRAFVYDQSLVSQAYVYFSDFARAKKMLDFFQKKALRKDGLFFSAYYVNNAKPAEDSVRSAPNIWLGIAIMQYTYKTKDQAYLKLAKDIAARIITLEEKSPQGGIPGAAELEWCSAENNLAGYVFFDMLYKVTGLEGYLRAKEKALNWLLNYAKDGCSSAENEACALLIAGIGPEKMVEMGMNPDRIIEFMEDNRGAQLPYKNPERIAQMAVAFKILSNFYYKQDMVAKARNYALKADDYLQGCLPYRATGSVAGTAYTLFAYYNYNPLELKD
ncbi:MAG: hypothetical protein PHG40_01335 [Candidatus Omnitrophica bacterium]|nr:hypothetical protein [Candidatus Omnitrophota bacterium]